jgi:hypothetical protein
MRHEFSLTPGFSPVPAAGNEGNRFNGFSPAGKPLKRLNFPASFLTRLKPGVNERGWAFARCFVTH